jgi:hypothetical protein
VKGVLCECNNYLGIYYVSIASKKIDSKNVCQSQVTNARVTASGKCLYYNSEQALLS